MWFENIQLNVSLCTRKSKVQLGSFIRDTNNRKAWQKIIQAMECFGKALENFKGEGNFLLSG